MDQSNIDTGVLKETKVTGGDYAWEPEGYRVVASDVPRRHQGGVEIFY